MDHKSVVLTSREFGVRRTFSIRLAVRVFYSIAQYLPEFQTFLTLYFLLNFLHHILCCSFAIHKQTITKNTRAN